jgi:hypothetical protein
MPNIPTNKKLYTKVKSQAKKKFKVWPSAYASGWLVRTYKKLGGKYQTSSRKLSNRGNIKSKSSKRRSKTIMKFSRRRKSVRKSPKRKSRRRKSVRKSRKRKSRRRKSVRKSPKRKSPRRINKKSSRSTKDGLSRWFSEEWIDVCKLPRIVPCGRKSASKSKRSYPYCRPRYKITSKSPKSARSLSSYEIKKRCRKKRKSPHKRILE